jgi:hypothetical protein
MNRASINGARRFRNKKAAEFPRRLRGASRSDRGRFGLFFPVLFSEIRDTVQPLKRPKLPSTSTYMFTTLSIRRNSSLSVFRAAVRPPHQALDLIEEFSVYRFFSGGRRFW